MRNPNCKIKFIYAPQRLLGHNHHCLAYNVQVIRFSSAIPVLFNNPVLTDKVWKATRMRAPPAQVCNLTGRRLAEVNLQQPAALISYQDREVGRP